MGKLAERYGDPARSGVYRVRDAAIPRAAAGEAGVRLLELTAAALANGGWDAVGAEPGPLVCLIRGAQDAALLRKLQLRARAARERGEAFFAVMIDPRGELALPPLYKERD